MKSESRSFRTITALQQSVQDYLDKQLQKMNGTLEKTQAEVALFDRFVEDLLVVGSDYEHALFTLCQNFQNKITDRIRDEKTCQYFQLVVNSLLRYVDSLQKRHEGVAGVQRLLRAAEKDFTNSLRVHLQVVETNLGNLRQKAVEFDKSYRKYIAANLKSMGETESTRKFQGPVSMSQMGESMNVADEEAVIKRFSDLESLLSFNVQHVRKILGESVQKEGALKAKAGKLALGLAATLGPGTKDELESKVKTIDSHLENFRLAFDQQLREDTLDFNELISFQNAEIRFFNYFQFLKVDAHLSQPQSRLIAGRLSDLEKFVSPRFRVYIELLVEFLFRRNVEFSKQVINDVSHMMSQTPLREYLLYSLILRKNVVLNDRQLAHVQFKRDQQKNLTTLAQFFFSSYLNRTDVNYELVFLFLRFTLLIVNEQKDSVIGNFARIALLHEVPFWQGMLPAIAGLNAKLDQSLGGALRDNLSQNVFNSVRVGLELSKAESRNSATVRAFEEVSLFLFKMQLDFEKIADILMELAPGAGISFEVVKSLLQRNQDLFLNQICEHNFIKQRPKKANKKMERLKVGREAKVAFALRGAVFYLNDIKDFQHLFGSSAYLFRNREQITKRLLLSPLGRYPESLRRFLYIIRTDLNPECLEAYRSDASADAEPIINLDVKRTSINCPKFDADMLVRVLANISRKDVGNVHYYQGLNYVACYFLTLFQGNELLSYRVIVSMLRSRCRRYFDRELRNLKKLFFFVKRLIKQYLPALHSHFEYELKMEIDMVCASWCLTFFTTALQYAERSPQLDEVIDIFMAQDWVGFCQVVLVIFDELQPRLLKSSYEDCVLLLNDIAKSGFRDVEGAALERDVNGSRRHLKMANRTSVDELGENPARRQASGFSFKVKIRKFRKVNAEQLAEFQLEHDVILEKMDEFWAKLSRKIRPPSTYNK